MVRVPGGLAKRARAIACGPDRGHLVPSRCRLPVLCPACVVCFRVLPLGRLGLGHASAGRVTLTMAWPIAAEMPFTLDGGQYHAVTERKQHYAKGACLWGGGRVCPHPPGRAASLGHTHKNGFRPCLCPCGHCVPRVARFCAARPRAACHAHGNGWPAESSSK